MLRQRMMATLTGALVTALALLLLATGPTEAQTPAKSSLAPTSSPEPPVLGSSYRLPAVKRVN